MVKLRNFAIEDAEILRQEQHHNMSIEEIEGMICDWNKLEYKGKYFEMFAIVENERIVGELSLYQISDSVISIGLEIFSNFQRQGFGKQAVFLALQICQKKGYKIACNQVLSDNFPSIALNKSLGFETDMYRYINQQGKEVFLFLKAI